MRCLISHPAGRRLTRNTAFTLPDLLITVAILSVLAAVILPLSVLAREKSRLAQCTANLQRVNRAMLQFAGDNQGMLPRCSASPAPGGWWRYKEQIKGLLGLTGPSSAKDQVFACPSDRGYGEGTESPTPFSQSAKYDFNSYVFNGVTLPGMPNIAGRQLGTIRQPARTLLIMEWTAHGPLSWHRSRTGQANTPFYNNAESVVGFVDGHVALTKIYYDGLNAAYTRDPVPGYQYQYSGD